MELNREQIIKALECCASEQCICEQCPIDEKIKDDCECGKVAARNALALINELTEANESLYAETKSQFDKISILTKMNKRLRGDYRKLNSVTLLYESFIEELTMEALTSNEKLIADTIRKMQTALTTFFANDDHLKYNEVDADYINEQINKIINEFLEEKT